MLLEAGVHFVADVKISSLIFMFFCEITHSQGD